MNYRHQFHAGNFADVMKHALLVRLVRAHQKKEKGFLYLDTHAGRGRYDLERAATGDSLARQPEWPDGIGRLWRRSDLPAGLQEYFALVQGFDREAGNVAPTPRFYPGSPRIAALLARAQDRLALAEKHPSECEALRAEFSGTPSVSVHDIDGYTAVRAMLPPPERRAVVLIDPPFEALNEFAQIVTAVREGLQRFPAAVFAVWYPLTGRARVDEFLAAVRDTAPPPTVAFELEIAGDQAPMKMKGCGLLVVNPPWQFEAEAKPILTFLADALAQAPGGRARVEWIVPER